MNQKVIYTCCVGGYDRLLQPQAVATDFDYVCFSDHFPEQRVGVWQVRPLPFRGDSPTATSRYPKLLPHRVLPEYEVSVYMDANVQILSQEFYDAVDEKVATGCLVAQVEHAVPPIACTYEEISFAFLYDKVSLLGALRQAWHLRRHGFPRGYGMFENNLIFRRHNDERVAGLSEQWWQEFTRRAPRDQFSLMYVYWKNDYRPDLLLPAGCCTRNSPWLSYHPHVAETADGPKAPLMERLRLRVHRHGYPLLRRCLTAFLPRRRP